MTLWLLIAGWALATGLAVQCARLSRRLELVARADHELRGPVSALALAVEALRRRPELRRRAAALDAHLDRLRLGLGDLAAARGGRRAAPRPAEVSLEGAARAVAEAWTPAARAAGGEISFEWRAGPVVAETDRARLSQALGNVLANAVEHGGERIAVAGERSADGVRIAVSDDGSRARDRGLGRPGDVPGALGRRTRRGGSGRGRGLTIAAAALDDIQGALRFPDLARRPSTRASARAGAGRTGRAISRADRHGQVRRRPGARGAPPAGGTEVHIELPSVDSPAP